MSLDIVEIRRKTFNAESVLVSITNIEEVAKWCDGIIKEDGEKENHVSRKYILVPVINPTRASQTQAYIGDWVVRQGRGFKVFNMGSLKGMFELRDGRAIGEEGRPRPNHKGKKKGKPQHQQNRGPNPSNMPKKLAPEPVPVTDEQVDKFRENLVAMHPVASTPEQRHTLPEEGIDLTRNAEVGEATKEIVNPEAAQAERVETLTASDLPVADAPGTIRNSEGEVIYDPSLPSAPPATNVEEHEDLAHQNPDEEAQVAVPLSGAEYDQLVRETEPTPEPKPITLDELNAQPGDPRTQNDILRERELGVAGSDPVVDTDDERTPGEVFRGEG